MTQSDSLCQKIYCVRLWCEQLAGKITYPLDKKEREKKKAKSFKTQPACHYFQGWSVKLGGMWGVRKGFTNTPKCYCYVNKLTIVENEQCDDLWCLTMFRPLFSWGSSSDSLPYCPTSTLGREHVVFLTSFQSYMAIQCVHGVPKDSEMWVADTVDFIFAWVMSHAVLRYARVTNVALITKTTPRGDSTTRSTMVGKGIIRNIDVSINRSRSTLQFTKDNFH